MVHTTVRPVLTVLRTCTHRDTVGHHMLRHGLRFSMQAAVQELNSWSACWNFFVASATLGRKGVGPGSLGGHAGWSGVGNTNCALPCACTTCLPPTQ